ncbi:MAG: hypothetical protein ACK5LR_11395 [Mangrovibacterium sp.]
MKKLFFLVMIAIAVSSCQTKGIELEIKNNCSGDISQVVCYTVNSGDTVFNQELIKAGELVSAKIKGEKEEVNFNFIFEIVRPNGRRDMTIESVVLSEEQKSAKILFHIEERNIQTEVLQK